MNPSRVLRARASAVLALALSFDLGASVLHRSAGAAETPRARRPAEPAGRLPLCFLPNAGQARPGVSFVAESTSARLEFRARGVDLWLRETGAASRPSLGLRFAGARGAALARGSVKAEGTANFFLGRDRSRWQSGVPTYRELEYEGLYPGIDLTYAARGDSIEAIYRLAPGARASRIRVRCRGARDLALDPDGSLVVRSAAGEMRQSRPRAYQSGPDGRREIAARFWVDPGAQTYGFRIDGDYDRSRPLVIDPTLAVSSYLGGGDLDAANAVAVDASGQIYLAGSTLSANFPLQSPLRSTPGGKGDAFVAKISASGTQLVYSTYLGGNDRDVALALAVDASGQAVVAGSTLSTDFPFGPGFRSSNAGGTDGFVTKLSASGSMILYSTYLGGSGLDVPSALAIDASGAAYVAGRTASTDFPLKGELQSSLRGIQDAFVTKLAASGAELVYSTYLGGSDVDGANGIAVDAAGQAVVAGFTQSINFPTASPLQAARGGNSDAFVTRFSADGANLTYSTYLGGSDDDDGNAVVIDSGGSAYVTGYTRSTDFPLQGAYQTTNRGGLDAFLARISTSGASLSLSTYLGGAGQDEGTAIARDPDGQIYVAGNTTSSDFPTANGLKATLSGESDGFVVEFSPDFLSLQFSTYLGGSLADSAFGLAVDSAKKIYVAGQTRSQDLTTLSARQTTFGGGLTDAFYLRIDPFDPTFVTSLYFPRLVTTSGSATTFDGSEYTGVAVVNLSPTAATLKFSAFDTAGTLLGGSGIGNPIQFPLAGRSQLARLDTEVFGNGLATRRPIGWFRLDSTVAETAGFFLVFNRTLTVQDGADVSSRTLTAFDFPEVEETANQGFTTVHVANPGAASASVTLELVRGDGTLAATATRSVAANGAVAEGVAQLFPGVATFDGGMYIRGTATRGVVPFEYLGKAGQYVEGLNGQDPALGARMIYSPQYVVGGAWRTTVSVVNFENKATTLSLRLIDNNGVVIGSRTQALAAGGKFQLAAQNFFLTPNPQLLTEGYLEITSDAANLGGSVVFGDAARSAYSAALPLLGKPQTSAIFSQVAKNSTYYTGLAVLNPSEASATFVLDVLDKAGTTVATRSVTLQGKRRTSRLLTDHFPALPDMTTGYFRITSDQGLLSFALFGTSSALSAIPPQAVP